MITNLFIGIVKGIVTFLVNLLPNYDTLPYPSAIDSAFDFLATAFQKANVLFPVDVVLIQLGILLTIGGAVLIFKASNFVVNKVRGAG